ncbi:MAG: methyltransferase [Magnetovibrio sp.]|nr:methyltransferase [Magnetovibrio sp.]
MSSLCQPGGLTKTHLLGQRVTCLQSENGFRVAIDALLLAAAVPARPGQITMDVGCGTGAAALCLAARIRGVHVTGLEIQPDLAELARRSAALSGLSARVDVVSGDLLDPPSDVTAGTFDHVFANPPYLKPGTGQAPANQARALATIEGDASLENWLEFCLARTTPSGTVTIVHRHDRMADILEYLGDCHGRVAVMSLIPKQGAAPKRVLVQVTKGQEGPISHLQGLILHEDDRRYSNKAEGILRHAQPLQMWDPGYVKE